MRLKALENIIETSAPRFSEESWRVVYANPAMEESTWKEWAKSGVIRLSAIDVRGSGSSAKNDFGKVERNGHRYQSNAVGEAERSGIPANQPVSESGQMREAVWTKRTISNVGRWRAKKTQNNGILPWVRASGPETETSSSNNIFHVNRWKKKGGTGSIPSTRREGSRDESVRSGVLKVGFVTEDDTPLQLRPADKDLL
jgi:hypothetical protein